MLYYYGPIYGCIMATHGARSKIASNLGDKRLGHAICNGSSHHVTPIMPAILRASREMPLSPAGQRKEEIGGWRGNFLRVARANVCRQVVKTRHFAFASLTGPNQRARDGNRAPIDKNGRHNGRE